MAANSLELIRDRVTSLVVGEPFVFALSPEPVSFDRVPALALDACCRIEAEIVSQVGGLTMSSDDTGRVTVWMARKTAAEADATYRRLLVDATSLVGAIVRDGATGGGDYDVPDGRTATISQRPGDDYAVLRLSVPVRYEAAL